MAVKMNRWLVLITLIWLLDEGVCTGWTTSEDSTGWTTSEDEDVCRQDQTMTRWETTSSEDEQTSDDEGMPREVSSWESESESDPALAKPRAKKSLASYLSSEVGYRKKKISFLEIERTLQDTCKCGLNCFVKMKSKKTILAARRNFWHQSRNVRMACLVDKVRNSETVGKFRFMDLFSNSVCSQAYIKLLGINKNTFTRAIQLSNSNSVTTGYTKERKMSDSRVNLMCWLEEHFSLYGERMPHKKSVVLPYGTRQGAVYEKYRADSPEHHVKRSCFYKTWKEHFPYVKARKTNSFTKCTTCSTIERQLAKTTCPQTRAEYRKQKDEHNQRQMLERKYYYSKRQTSQRYPKEYLSLIIDGMDQAKTNLPHFAGRQPKCINPTDLLKTHVTGVLSHGAQEFRTYVCINEYPSDPNLTINILLKMLLHTATMNDNKLPPTLFLQADNCYRENKNRYVLSFCELMVRRKIFLEVHLSFLPVGHTHEDIDGKFSELSEKIRTRDIETLSDLLTTLPSARVITEVFNYKAWVEPFIETVDQISRPLHYKFTTVDDQVIVYYKGSHHQTWNKLGQVLRDTPSNTPTIIDPDFSKIDIEKHVQQIENIRALFKSKETYGQWKKLYNDMKEKKVHSDEERTGWILDLLPKQEERVKPMYSIIPEVRELIQKETQEPRVVIRKRRITLPDSPSNRKKTRPEIERQGNPKQTVVYFYTDYRKRKGVDMKFIMLIVELLFMSLLSIYVLYIDYILFFIHCVYTMTAWQRQSLFVLLNRLFIQMIESHLQYFAHCDYSVMMLC